MPLTARIRLGLELVREAPLKGSALPALEAARDRGEGEPLVRAARAALPLLRASLARPEPGEPDAGGELALARLEAVVATAPEPPASEGALEEVAWALLRAARVAPPVSLGDDWDLLRALLDPARRRQTGLGALAATLAGSALVGAGPLESRSGFALARRRSYATGWNDPERTRRIARALARWTPARLEAAAARVGPALARGIYPPRRTPIARRLERARAALALLQDAYALAAREGAGVFVELEIA